MKARGLRNARTNVNVLPSKPVTRAAIKREPAAQGLVASTPAVHQSTNVQKAEEKENVEKVQPMEIDCKSPDSLSTSLDAKFKMIGDIDCIGNDWKNSQLVACYVKDIFSYLQSIESSQAISSDFLCQPAKLEITPRMHKILFDWLVQVHQRFTLLPETLYLSFHIIDYYMSVCGAEIKKSCYQLLGVTAMFLASKYEEIYPPEINDFVFLTDNTYTVREVREMERKLLSRLEFFLGFPLEIQFLRRYSKVSQASAAVHEMAKYLTELGRTHYPLAHLPPSGLSAAAFCLAAELLADYEGSRPNGWVPELEVFSGYSRRALLPTMQVIARLVLQLQTEQKYTAVKKKYTSRVFSCISNYPEVTDPQNAVLLRYAS